MQMPGYYFSLRNNISETGSRWRHISAFQSLPHKCPPYTFTFILTLVPGNHIPFRHTKSHEAFEAVQFDDTGGKDPLLADFVLIHSPVKLIAAILVFLKLLEEWVKERDAYTFARPAFLVNCGLTFGVNGCGVLLAIAGERRQLALALPLAHVLLLACLLVSAVTDGGGHLYQCLERSHLSLSTICCRYILFVNLATLVYDLLSLVLCTKKSSVVLRRHMVCGSCC